MKSTLIIAASILISVITHTDKHDSKLVSVFNKTFPDAKNVKWHEDANGSVVFFTMNEISNRICYDTKENFIEEDRYYTESNLPAYILIAIKKTYPEKNIIGVTEIINTSSVYYQVHLRDDRNLFTINVASDGTVHLEKKFFDANPE